MEHACEIISIDMWADNALIVTCCLIELDNFIESALPQSKEKHRIKIKKILQKLII